MQLSQSVVWHAHEIDAPFEEETGSEATFFL
jgi:hypothetical protein